tara:strand:+ start:9991 stop:11199 length:1209 start_codon:yes stop_codon:yes gene_type:complete
MPDIKVRVGQQNTVKVLASAYGGSLTAETATNVIGGIASVSQLSNTGVSTLGGPILAGGDLRVAGVSTFVGVSTFGGDVYIEGDLYLKDDITLDDINANSLTISGISTLGVTSTTLLESQQLNVTGVSTFVGVSTFSGDVYIGGDLYLNDDITLDEISARSLTISGISTLSGQVGLGSNLNVAGISTFSDDITLATNKKLKVGTANTVSLWNNGSITRLQGEGDAVISVDTPTSFGVWNGATSSALFKPASSVDLYYAGTKRFETISTGASVTGDLYVSGDLSIDDLTLDHINGTTLNITGIATFGSDVSIGGTLTYEDVTNVDSVGIVTAGKGLRATTGGLVVTAGVSTFSAGAVASTLKVSDLTSGRVVYAGASGELQDSTNLTFDGTELSAGLIDGGSY